jgi:hypothetical protein
MNTLLLQNHNFIVLSNFSETISFVGKVKRFDIFYFLIMLILVILGILWTLLLYPYVMYLIKVAKKLTKQPLKINSNNYKYYYESLYEINGAILKMEANKIPSHISWLFVGFPQILEFLKTSKKYLENSLNEFDRIEDGKYFKVIKSDELWKNRCQAYDYIL